MKHKKQIIDEQKQPQSPKSSKGVLSALANVLLTVVERLEVPTYLFVIGIGVLIVIALVISATSKSFTPLFVTIGALTALALGALGVRILITRTNTVEPSLKPQNPETLTQPEPAIIPSIDQSRTTKSEETQMDSNEVKPATHKSDEPDTKVLLGYLEQKFLMQDLRRICFQMGWEWDNLPGEAKTEKIISLVTRADKRERLPDLVAEMRKIYPTFDC